MSELEETYKALQKLAKSYIKKSASEPVTKADIAKAISEATKTPEGAQLAKRIVLLERQQAAREAYGLADLQPEPEPKPSRYDEDEWASYFEEIED